MKNFVAVCMAALLFSLPVSGQEKKVETAKPKEKQAVVKTVKAFNVVCPVSGEETDDAVTSVYNGKTYALCCKRCLQKFEKNPELYSQNLSKDGKKFTKH